MGRDLRPLLIKITSRGQDSRPDHAVERSRGIRAAAGSGGEGAPWEHSSTLFTEQKSDPTGDEQTER